MFANIKEVHEMTAGFVTMQQHPDCCTNSAAACTSARLGIIVDTAIAAVSIFIVWLIGFLLRL